MLEAIKGILGSKRALAAIVGVIAGAVVKLGWHIDTETLMAILSPVLAYILGQSYSDQGKGQAEVYAKQTVAALAGQVADTSRVPTSGNSGSVGL